jgi:small subunit ribosomal protein S19
MKKSRITDFKTTKRSITLHPLLYTTTFKLHNGKSYYDVVLNKLMIGHKLGEFVFTRKKCIFRNKKSKKKHKTVKKKNNKQKK